MTNRAIPNTGTSRYTDAELRLAKEIMQPRQGQAENTEKDIFFLHLARESGKAIRMDFSWCLGGYGARIIPDKDNPYGWQIIFDAPEQASSIEEGAGDEV